jgi:hypothetical protein
MIRVGRARPNQGSNRSRSRCLVVFSSIPLILAAAGSTPLRSEAAPVTRTAVPADCGTGPTWPTKIGADSQAGQVDLTSPPTPTTVAQLTSLPLPSPIVHRVRPTETTVYTITARLKAMHTEHDRDLHMVVDDGSGHFMITELPDSACVPTSSPFYPGIAQAHSQLAAWSGSVPVTAQVTGVGFFDNFTGQPDQAPNQIELHPILNLIFNPGSITGRVTSTVGGGSISGGAVVDSQGVRTATDSLGVYTLSGLAPGSHSLTASANGFTSGSQTTWVSAGQATTGVNFSLAPAGLLRVMSSPTVPTQIVLDGQIADSWGLNWLELAPGNHEVCFTHAEGWTEPPCQTVSVNGGITTVVTGSFIQRGSLRVLTSPAVHRQITLDGNPIDDWGVFTDIPAGVHTVCYGKVANYDPPACQSVDVGAGVLTTTVGAFTAHPGAVGQSGLGSLRVVTSPALASQITITPGAGSPYITDSWGLNWLELAPGSYTVTFSHVTGYTEPAPQTVTVTAGNTTPVTGSFTQRGSLRVLTSPPVAGTVLVDAIPRNDWGLWTDIPTGSHTVCFGSAAGYASVPGCQTVLIMAGVETDVTGSYG